MGIEFLLIFVVGPPIVYAVGGALYYLVA